SLARGIEEGSRGDREVHRRVTDLAQEIASLSRAWWPGSVRALRLDAAPRDCVPDLSLPDAAAPSTWLEVVEAAERRLEALVDRDEREGRDDFGWADAAALSPGPPDAEG